MEIFWILYRNKLTYAPYQKSEQMYHLWICTFIRKKQKNFLLFITVVWLWREKLQEMNADGCLEKYIKLVLMGKFNIKRLLSLSHVFSYVFIYDSLYLLFIINVIYFRSHLVWIFHMIILILMVNAYPWIRNMSSVWLTYSI